MTNETDGEIGKLIKGLVQGQQVEAAFVAPDGTITIPHGEATLTSVDVADVDLLLSFPNETFVIIPNGALDAITDPSHLVVFTDNGDSSFDPSQPGSDNKSTLGDLFKMVGISNHAKAGSLRVVSENVDAAKTPDDVDAAKTDEDQIVTSSYVPPPPAPLVKVGSGIALAGKGPGLGAGGYSEEVVDTADPVVALVTERPSVYKAGHKIDTITLDTTVATPTVA